MQINNINSRVGQCYNTNSNVTEGRRDFEVRTDALKYYKHEDHMRSGKEGSMKTGG